MQARVNPAKPGSCCIKVLKLFRLPCVVQWYGHGHIEHFSAITMFYLGISRVSTRKFLMDYLKTFLCNLLTYSIYPVHIAICTWFLMRRFSLEELWRLIWNLRNGNKNKNRQLQVKTSFQKELQRYIDIYISSKNSIKEMAG